MNETIFSFLQIKVTVIMNDNSLFLFQLVFVHLCRNSVLRNERHNCMFGIPASERHFSSIIAFAIKTESFYLILGVDYYQPHLTDDKTEVYSETDIENRLVVAKEPGGREGMD